MAGRAGRRFLGRLQDLLFAWVVACAALPAAIGLLTYLPYYEDETWTFVPAFEFVRGNGFSWGMFNEGQGIFAVAYALTLPAVLASPFQPEETVRLFALSCGVIALGAVYVCARRLAPGAAWVAPAVLVATPVMFPALRYGRTDVEALLLGALALAAAAWKWPLAAGVLSALAVSVHPVYVWLGFPCLALASGDGARAVRRYVLGGVLGLLPQALWTLTHLQDHRELWDRYSRTSNDSPGAILDALRLAPDRFRVYFETLPDWQLAFHVLAYVVLPLAALWLARERVNRLAIAGLVAAPLLATSALVASRNYYYVHFVALPLALAAAIAAARLPAAGRVLVMLAVVAASAITLQERIDNARASRGNVTQRDVVAALTRELPPNSVVFVPVMYAGLLDTRHDLRLFAYHALSNKPRWGLPGCGEFDARLHSLVREDARSSPPNREASEVYFVTYTPFLPYLRQIFSDAGETSLQCMLGAPGAEQKTLRLCHRRRAEQCGEVVITRRHLP